MPKITVQASLSLTGMMFAYFGAGIALVEPFLLASMPMRDLVARPLRPRIELKTLLVRNRSAPRSSAMDEFVAHLKQTVRQSARR